MSFLFLFAMVGFFALLASSGSSKVDVNAVDSYTPKGFRDIDSSPFRDDYFGDSSVDFDRV